MNTYIRVRIRGAGGGRWWRVTGAVWSDACWLLQVHFVCQRRHVRPLLLQNPETTNPARVYADLPTEIKKINLFHAVPRILTGTTSWRVWVSLGQFCATRWGSLSCWQSSEWRRLSCPGWGRHATIHLWAHSASKLLCIRTDWLLRHHHDMWSWYCTNIYIFGTDWNIYLRVL